VANPNKQRGTAWESATRDYLNDFLGLYVDHWRDLPPGVTKFRNPADPLNVKRQAQEGNHDVGDLHAWPFVVECKDVKSSAVPAWIRQGLVEAKNAGFPFAVAVRKNRNFATRTASVYIDVRTFTRLRLFLQCPSAAYFAGCYHFELSARGTDTGRWYFRTDLLFFADLLRAVRAQWADSAYSD
jgi:hypothetical protein